MRAAECLKVAERQRTEPDGKDSDKIPFRETEEYLKSKKQLPDI